jgi:hypothetical protein
MTQMTIKSVNYKMTGVCEEFVHASDLQSRKASIGVTVYELSVRGPARDGPSISLSIGLRREPLVLVVVVLVLVLES